MKVLVSSHNPFIEVAKHLHENGHEIFSTSREFSKVLSDVDIPNKILIEYIDENVKKESFLYAYDILSRLTPPLICDWMNESQKRFFSHDAIPHFYQRLSELGFMVGALNALKPDISIVENDVTPFTRSVAAFARANNSICLHIPHSIYMNTEKGKVMSDIHDLTTATNIAVAGEYQWQWYKNRGFNENNIKMTGLPQFDMFRKTLPNKTIASSILKLNPTIPVITYASSWRQDTNLLGCHDGVESDYLRFLNTAKHLRPAQFIVKLHPGARNLVNNYIELAKENGVQCLVTAEYLNFVLAATDAILAYGPSNILLEASMVNGIRLLATHGYDDDPAVIKVGQESTPEEVANIIKQSLSVAPDVGNQILFTKKYCGTIDGGATDRIVNYIEELCK